MALKMKEHLLQNIFLKETILKEIFQPRTLSTAPPRPWRSTTLRRTLQLTSRRSLTKSKTTIIEFVCSAHMIMTFVRYNPTWHCIVGRNFGSYVTHETRWVPHFKLQQISLHSVSKSYSFLTLLGRVVLSLTFAASYFTTSFKVFSF